MSYGKKIEWTEALSMGIGAIDDQHRTLIDLCNLLIEVVDNGDQEGVSESVLMVGEEYARGHLHFEEEMLRRAGFPEEESHAAGHRRFEVKFEEFAARYEVEPEGFDMKEVADFVLDWLYGHILKEDRKYADWFAERGGDVDLPDIGESLLGSDFGAVGDKQQ
ncbi:MAG: hypothetical protein VR70_11010 [Rhodospirillaceae bacterium BRH_c57]|nr:MAG: hypothetical protein VR70_11010 [Rhodospirillaceae bacterium BRH_c57]